MSKGIYIQEGSILDYRNETAAEIKYCDVVPLTGAIGIAECGIPSGALGTISVCGVYELPAETSAAFTMGQKLYWNTTVGVVTATATDNIPCGMAVTAKAQSAATVRVRLG